jgi:L-aspartate oxidase
MFFGIYTVNHIAPNLTKNIKSSLLASIPDWINPNEEENFEDILLNNDLKHIQSIMWNYAGIIRTKKRLLRALSDLGYLSHRIEQFYKQAKLTRKLIELRNSVLTATIIVRTAYSNKNPLGCHYIE